MTASIFSQRRANAVHPLSADGTARSIDVDSAAIAFRIVDGWFTPEFRQGRPETVQRMRDMLTANSIDGYIASCAAVRDADQWESIRGIRRPTLVISGTHEAARLAADGRRMAESIDGAQCVELAAAHISNVEAADRFNLEVMRFLDRR